MHAYLEHFVTLTKIDHVSSRVPFWAYLEKNKLLTSEIYFVLSNNIVFHFEASVVAGVDCSILDSGLVLMFFTHVISEHVFRPRYIQLLRCMLI